MKVDEAALAKAIGKTMARLRQAKGMTQEAVAEQLQIGNEAVSRLERGVVMPTIARLLELAVLFDCDLAELVEGVSPRSTDQAHYLGRLLSQLNEQDRRLVVDVAEKLAHHLGHTDGGNKKTLTAGEQ